MRFLKGQIPWNKKEIAWEVNQNGCWICTSHKTNESGYPLYQHKGKKYLLHRFIYEKTYGKFDSRLKVCHHCDNPACVNPEHLFLGTQKDNMIDMNLKGRHGYTGSPGEKNPHAKFTNKQIIKIREMYNNGLRQVHIARMFGVKQQTISGIVNKKSWIHI